MVVVLHGCGRKIRLLGRSECHLISSQLSFLVFSSWLCSVPLAVLSCERERVEALEVKLSWLELFSQSGTRINIT